MKRNTPFTLTKRTLRVCCQKIFTCPKRTKTINYKIEKIIQTKEGTAKETLFSFPKCISKEQDRNFFIDES